MNTCDSFLYEQNKTYNMTSEIIQKPIGLEFAKEHMSIPFAVCGGYLTFIYFFSNYMKNVQPFSLKKPLIYWNTSLCIFSFIGSLQTVPLLVNLIYNSTEFKDTICTSPSSSWGQNQWVGFFVYSKIPELVDTFFIVARKRPLIFLHWYHHVTVLLYCWHSYAVEAPQALYFISMNYSVHTIMYGYYALSAMKIKSVWLPPSMITTTQILQMIVGLFVQCNASYHYLYNSNDSCSLNGENIFWGGIMYASYLKLFSDFALKRYIKHSNIKK
jgi:elongation of very long chain fatty acids protein 6